jgi:hypothetical protein
MFSNREIVRRILADGAAVVSADAIRDTYGISDAQARAVLHELPLYAQCHALDDDWLQLEPEPRPDPRGTMWHYEASEPPEDVRRRNEGKRPRRVRDAVMRSAMWDGPTTVEQRTRAWLWAHGPGAAG